LATPAAAVPSPAALPGPTPIPLAGKDYDVTLLDASRMKLSKLLGRKKVVVVNFWATWCGPCRKEIPELIALQKDYASKNVEIVGLSVEDPAQAMTLVKNYKDQAQINYKVGFAPMPMFIAFNGARPGAPIPQTFIFGKDGKLLYHLPGLRPAFKDYVAQAIDTALKS
jgi:thiol-disulfide isomerase/thioredoxin